MKSRLRLFFSPYKYAKGDVFFFVLRMVVFTTFGGLLISYLLSRFSALLLERNIHAFEQLIYGFSVSLALYYLFVFFIRHTGLAGMRSKVRIFIHRRYVKMVCELDNNYAESLGSARLFSIVDKGGQAWAESLKVIFQETTRIIILVIPTCVLIGKQSINIILIM